MFDGNDHNKLSQIIYTKTTMTNYWADFVIGNTFEIIPEQDAKLDQSGQHLKTMKWTVYLDVVEAGVVDCNDILAQVEAKLPWGHYLHRPKQIMIGNKSRWRCFESTQETWAIVPIQFTITGVGGTTRSYEYMLRDYLYEQSEPMCFMERKPRLKNPFPPSPLPQNTTFRLARIPVDDDYSGESDRMDVDFENNNHGRFYSEDLRGEEGVQFCRELVQELSGKKFVPCIRVNVYDNSLEDLVKICQNVVKYEDAVDTIIQKYDGIPHQENDPFQSNKICIPGNTNKARHQRLASCQTVQELCAVMNPSSKSTYKFNVLDAEVEFCFGISTCDITVVEALVRYCVQFVHNSARFRVPGNCKDSTTVGEQTNLLFKHVIKDNYVESCLRPEGMVEPGDISTIECSGNVPVEAVSQRFFDVVASPITPAIDDLTLDSCSFNISSAADVTPLPELPDLPGQLVLPNRKRPRHGKDAELLEGMLVALQHCEQEFTSPDDEPQDSSQKRVESPNQREQESTSPNDSRYPFFDQPTVASPTKSPIRPILKEMIRDGSKDFKARFLSDLLGKLNAGKGRDIPKRLKNLQVYFDKREEEMAMSVSEDTGLPRFGIELIDVDPKIRTTGTISIIIRGGRQLVRDRHGVNTALGTSTEQLSFEDLGCVLKDLGRPVASDFDARVQELDNYIEGIFAERLFPGNVDGENGDKKNVNFAILVQNLPV